MIKLTAPNTNTKANIKNSTKYSKTLSDIFPNKSILEKIFLFLSPKIKFLLLRKSKHLLEEYDSKIDDYYIPRKYQEKIKNYNNNYEDLFYQILNDIKKDKEKNGEKVCLYEFENSMIKYLKYLTMKYNKIIKISLINVNNMEIWKLEFISKLLDILDKNVHLKLKFNYLDLKTHEIFAFICRFSKAINILEIVDVFTNKSQFSNLNDEINSCLNWSTITKIIINMSDYKPIDGYEKKRSEKFLIHALNTIETPNLIDFDLRCNFINFNEISKFLEKNGKNIRKLNVENYKLNNESDIENNLVLNKFENINELSLAIEEKYLEKLLYFFYPIFPKIKSFHLIINENENENIDDNDEKIKKNEKKTAKNKNRKNKNKNKTNYYFDKKDEDEGEDERYTFPINQINFISKITNFEDNIDEIFDDENEDFSQTKDINLKKISFTTEKKEKINYRKGKNQSIINFISTLSNLNNCETLTYEIKTNINSNANTKINSLSYLLNCLEENKAHLKYLEIYINNDEYSPINVKDFTLLIQRISACINLNTFIFECELYNEYAFIFNTYFNIGQNLTHLSLIHTTDLDIMKIINRHDNLSYIKFELISKKSKMSKTEYINYSFNLDLERNWKSIDLTNYPINQSLVNILKYNKSIYTSFNFCTNVSGFDDLIVNEIIKNSCENNENKW